MLRTLAALLVLLSLSSCLSPAITQNVYVSSIVPQFTIYQPSTNIAPCQLFLDATATVDPSQTTYPFGELDYAWTNSGGSGNWSYGSNTAKANAAGPLAAFVQDTPGTYTITLTVRDALGAISISQSYTCNDPATSFSGTKTTCISSTALPVAGSGGCPSGAGVACFSTGVVSGCTQETYTFDQALSTYALTGQRVLFLCTDTFTSSATEVMGGSEISNTGPGTLDDYGPSCGASLPTIQYGGSVDNGLPMLFFASNISNWRVRNFAFNSNGHINEICDFGASVSQILLENIQANSTVYSGCSPFQPATPLDQIFIVGSSITNINSGGLTGQMNKCAMWFMNGVTRAAIIGDDFDHSENCFNGYDLRFQSEKWVVIANTNLGHPPPGHNTLDLHGPTSTSALTTSQYIVISNVVSNSNNVTSVVAGCASPPCATANLVVDPQNAMSVEDISDVILDSVEFIIDSLTTYGSVVEARNVTYRNGIIDEIARPAGVQCHGINVNRNSGSMQPQPTNLNFYQMTMYGPTCASAGSDLIDFTVAVGTTTGKNLLMYTPASASSTIVGGCGGCALTTAAGNSTGAQITGTNPFLSTPMSGTPSSYAPTGYALPAIPPAGQSVVTPVFYDFFRTLLNGSYQVGAIQ